MNLQKTYELRRAAIESGKTHRRTRVVRTDGRDDMSAGGHGRFVVNTQCAVVRDGRYLMIVRGEGVKQAPGVLAFPGGKVEVADGPGDVLESAVRREVLEETGVTVSPGLEYVRSSTFTMADGTAVVDVLFLADYEAGKPEITAPEEVAEIRWMATEEILAHDRTPPWLKISIDRVEAVRRRQTRCR